MVLTPNATVVDLPGYFAWINQETSGVFGWVILIVIFVVFFAIMKNYQSEAAFTYSAFLTLLCSLLLAVMNIVDYMTVTVFIILLAIAVVVTGRR